MIRCSPILLLSFAAVLLTACGTSVTANSTPTAGGPAGLNRYDLATYYGSLHGQLSLHDIDPTTPDIRDVTSERWLALVAKERRIGLSRLAPSERQVLLSGAFKAYFTLVASARYSIEIPGSDRTATVTELYSAQQSPDRATRIDVVGRQVVGSGISAALGAVPRLTAGAPDDSRQIGRFGSNGRFTLSDWTHGTSGWRCTVEDTTGPFRFVALTRILLLGALLNMPVNESVSIGGRLAFEFSPVGSNPRAMSIVIDASTLWPIRYEYLDQSGRVRAQETLTAVNADDLISAPADPSTCSAGP